MRMGIGSSKLKSFDAWMGWHQVWNVGQEDDAARARHCADSIVFNQVE